MLDKIILFSIRNKLIIGLFVLSLIGWGIYSVNQLTIDAVPDITNNQVQIITTSTNYGTEDIERNITFPIEQVMATLPSIEEVRSFSRFGLSVITLVFKDDIDVYWARQQVSERLTEAAKQIPPGMGIPQLAPVTTGLGEIYQYIIHPKKGFENKYSATDLRTIQDWIVRRQLLGVDGIADVSSFGGFVKQYEVAINPSALAGLKISVIDVINALNANNQNTGATYIDKKPNAYFIRSEGLIKTLDDIENIVIKSTSTHMPVLIKHVAKVQFGAATRYGAMTRNNEGEVVGAIVLMLKGANSSKVIENVKERMEQIKKTLPEGIEIEPFLDRSKLIQSATTTIAKNLAEGALIVIFVLVLLLGNLKAGLIVASVIPLSMLFAISMMNFFGISGNLMSLGAIDFGLIIDGAVIIVEASLFHLLLFKDRKLTQLEMDNEIFVSTSKIRNSAAFGEIIILIVYLPILALIGIEGKMFKPMAQTVSFAIIGAFILSLTYVPMISALFLSKKQKPELKITHRIIQKLHQFYEPILVASLKFKKAILIGTLTLFTGCIIAFYYMGSEFIPTLEEGDFAVETRVLAGSSLSQTIEVVQKSAKVLSDSFPEVIAVIGKIGSSEIPTDPMPVEAADLIITLKNKKEWTSAKDRDELSHKMHATLMSQIPGVTYGFQQPIQMRFNELMTGVKQDIAIKIYGEDLEKLSAYAHQIGNLVGNIEGAEDVYVEKTTGQQQIIISYDRAKIASFGLNINDINTIIRANFAGEITGLVYEGEKRFELVVRLHQDSRNEVDDLFNLFITTPNGNTIPLSNIAHIDFKEGLNQIQRDDAKRRTIVGFNVRGRDIQSVVDEIQLKISSKIALDPGYFIQYGGTFENLIAAKKRLSIAVPISLLLIFILLFFTFKSTKYAILIFACIPFSAIGGIIALFARDMPFSISAGIGFIALFGVSVLNGIVLISEFNTLKAEGELNLETIIKKGTSRRLRPVFMTALVASLGFLPMALSHGSGAEVQKPLATVVIGGLISATILTLIVLPILYLLIENFKMKSINSILIPILILFISSNSVSAQTQLSLSDAVEIALKNNLLVKNANKEIELKSLTKKQLNEIPKTQLGLLHGQYNSIAKNDNNISINQSIPFPTTFNANKNLGNQLIQTSKANLEQLQDELIYSVKSIYLSLQYSYAKQGLVFTQDSLLQIIATLTQKRINVGEASLMDKTIIENQQVELKIKMLEINSEIENNISKLKSTLNTADNISIKNKILSENNIALLPKTSALENNSKLLYLNLLTSEYDYKKQAEFHKNLPNLNFGYFNQSLIGYQNINNKDFYFNGKKRFQGFQIGLSIPLFYSSYKANLKSLNVQKEISENYYTHLQNQLNNEYNALIKNYINQQKAFEFYNNTVSKNYDYLIKAGIKSLEKGEINFTQYLFTFQQALISKENLINHLYQLNSTVNSIHYFIHQNEIK